MPHGENKKSFVSRMRQDVLSSSNSLLRLSMKFIQFFSTAVLTAHSALMHGNNY